jgi:hypothetical protein
MNMPDFHKIGLFLTFKVISFMDFIYCLVFYK